MRTTTHTFRTAVMASLLMLVSAGVSAQGNMPPPEQGVPSSQMPGVLAQVSFDQRLDARLPLDAPFKDDAGHDVTLGQYFGTKPVVLAFVYYECPMLCNQVLNGMTSALDVIDESIGAEYDVVTISFDARETPVQAAAKKAAYLERYKRPGAAAGWHFLTGTEASIAAVTKAAGFSFVWDEASQQFAHGSGIMVATPDGRLSRYFFGIEYAPRDIEFALIESSNGRIGTLAEKVVLYCYHYDPTAGTYAFDTMRAVRMGGGVTVVAILGFVVVSLRRERAGAGH